MQEPTKKLQTLSWKEYVPRQAQKDPEAVTNDDKDTRGEFTLNDWDEWFDSSLECLITTANEGRMQRKLRLVLPTDQTVQHTINKKLN